MSVLATHIALLPAESHPKRTAKCLRLLQSARCTDGVAETHPVPSCTSRRRARKLRRAVDAVTPLLEAAESEVEYLEQVGAFW